MGPAVTRQAPPGSPGAAPTRAGAIGVAELSRGVLAIRWAVLVWMLVLTVDAVAADRAGTVVPVVSLAVAVAWVVWLTLTGPPRTTPVLAVDLAVAAGLIAVGVANPWFATVFPVTAALAWGVARGLGGGLVAGGMLGAVSVATTLLLAGDGAGTQVVPSLRDPVNLLLAGGGLGYVSALLERSAVQVRAAQEQQVRATERAARATERESLGRQIHDSVLQALALVHKRGRELADRPTVAPREIARLADLAAEQERALRALILRPAGDAEVDGRAPLRDRLEQVAAPVRRDVAVSVTSVGRILLPSASVRELAAAVEQALHNVIEHAGADHVWVYAETVDGELVLSVRDDGRGFVFDEAGLRAAGKFGLLRSICGRTRDLGGHARVDTAPGRGTEIEMRVPAGEATRRAEGTRG